MATWLSIDAATIRTQANLLPHQFGKDLDEAALETEITTIAADACSYVLGRLCRSALRFGLIASLDNDLDAVLNANQKERALTAAKTYAIALMMSGLDDEGSQTIAKTKADGRGEVVIGGARITSCEGILLDLEKDFEIQAQVQAGSMGAGASSIDVVRDDSESGGCGEYAWCNSRRGSC